MAWSARIFIVLLLTLLSAGSGTAQDATPATTAAHSLSDLGLPELAITVTDTDIIAPGEVDAGRYLVSYTNTGSGSRHSQLLRVPGDKSIDALLNASGGGGDQPPDWFLDSTFVGFPGEVTPGQTQRAVVDLEPGLHWILDDFSEIFIVAPTGPIEGATPVPAALTSDATVTMLEYGFTFPESLNAGQQVWEITNAGAEPHELLLVRSPEVVTLDEVLAIAMDEDATTASGVGFDDMVPVGGLGWLSPGRTAWTELTLEPGTYVAVCFFFTPDFSNLHAFAGMIQVITVS